MKIKIDKSTLPEPERRLKFMIYEDTWLEGEYDDHNMNFICDDGSFYDHWIVWEWEYLTEDKNYERQNITGVAAASAGAVTPGTMSHS